jgi:hypothetical protein
MPSLFLTSAGKGKRIVLWTLAGIALSQLALSIYLDRRRLETRDPLYGHRLHSLQARLAESPNAPLFLILGSSRVKYSVCPSAMTIHSAGGTPAPIVYNFAMNGMGTIRELMYFHRLMADGIRPKWLLIEVWPPLWAESGFFRESRMVQGEDDLHWRDLPLLYRYFRNDRDVLHLAVRKCLLPIRTYRDLLLSLTGRSLLTVANLDEIKKRIEDSLPVDSNGWFPLPWETITAEAKQRGLLDGIEKIKPLLEGLHPDPRSDRALRELLEECRRHGIKTALILMPEPSFTRGWYSPQTRRLVREYLTRIQQQEQVPIIDARAWQPDDEFADASHMARVGVPAFSARLGREVVQPLIEDRPFDPSILFADGCSDAP